MLEILRGKATRSYENTFFREFAKKTSQLFEKYKISGLLVANPECEISQKLQIDILLVTSNTVCIIDLKNFGGDIILPTESAFSESTWLTSENEIIKGGSYINPYKQLAQQKKAFIWVYHNSELKNKIKSYNDQFNPSHVKKVVCFQKPISLENNIPNKDEIDFFITDSNRYLECIKDIIDVVDNDINLSKKSYGAFKDIYKAEAFSLYENENLHKVSLPPIIDTNLYDDQKLALQKIQDFLLSDDQVFILKGSAMSGKSFLLPKIRDLAFKNDIKQVEFFASSARVAHNLMGKNIEDVNSIYSYIYAGNAHRGMKDTRSEDDENSFLEVVPLKNCTDEASALFVVDEAQLISDSYNESFDLRFGSGKLLNDFVDFTGLKNNDDESNRKIIFMGDDFQIKLGKTEENSLCEDNFIKNYNITPHLYELCDKPNNPIVNQALSCVEAIRTGEFNTLEIISDDNISILERLDVRSKMENNLHAHYLTFTNTDAKRVNEWIKKNIIKSGIDIAKNDLLIVNNTFNVDVIRDEKLNFLKFEKILNGKFFTISAIADTVITETILLKNNISIELKFLNLQIQSQQNGDIITIMSLENYRLNEKAELSANEIIAYKILLNRELKIALKSKPFEYSHSYIEFQKSSEYKTLNDEISELEIKLRNSDKVKTKLADTKKELQKLAKKYERKHKKEVKKELEKDVSSGYFKYKNHARVRFGWALTVHRSVSYKWNTVFFNVSQGATEGRFNKNYFSWLYTGLTRARNNIYLINHKPINPFINTTCKESSQTTQSKDVYFICNIHASLNEQKVNCYKTQYSYDNSCNNTIVNIMVQLYEFITVKLNNTNLLIESIIHNNYQETYQIKQKDDFVKVSFYYNGKGHIKPPKVVKSSSQEFADEVLDKLTQNSGLVDFDFITDDWRRDCYIQIVSQLPSEIILTYVVQESYKDKVQLTYDNQSIEIDMYYNDKGFFSTLIAHTTSNNKLWMEFKEVINNLKLGT